MPRCLIPLSLLAMTAGALAQPASPAEKPAEKPVEKTVENAVDKSAGKSVEKPVEKAAEKPAAKPASLSADSPVARVEVKGAAEDYDPRRDDTASKTIISNAEIMKYGDTNVFDVLKRAPGVTVIGNSVRMRGLGNGYTQMLVNGERPPPGFSLDNLPPEQIERIEVVRAASAEFSMQAVAGTINIVTKKTVAKAQRDLRLNVSHAPDQRDAALFGTVADKAGNLSWTVNSVLARSLRDSPSGGLDDFTTPEGDLVQQRDWRRSSANRATFLGAQPRLSWKLPGDDMLHVNAFVQASWTDGDYSTAYTNRIGRFSAVDYVDRHSETGGRSRFVGADANWVAKLGGGKLDAKINLSHGRTSNDSDELASTLASTEGAAVRLRRQADNQARYNTVSSTGKYSRTMFEGHALATGWEINRQQTEDNDLRIEGVIGTTPVVIPEQFRPTVLRYAAYGQDEWNVTKNWSVYLGARWEAIRTDSEGTGLHTTQSNSHVLSPVAQTLYKFPDKSGRQVRLALTRTYKAPTTAQLTARRTEAPENTRFNPDSTGNPDLRPELANGIDLTYEHFWAPGAVFSVGTSQRRIRDYIRSRLSQDSDGRWLNQPLNDGNATVRSLDVELKFPLKTLVKDAPAFDFRASVNKNWSQVDTVPGPDNRLDQQVPLTANLGLDYRADRVTAGTSFAYRQGTPVRTSPQQTIRLFQRRDLDAYLLYKYTPGAQLRVSVNNLLGEDTFGYSRYGDANGTSRSWSRSHGYPRLSANLELKF
jgi:outer membrane receptor for ferrienterochelin and colicins